jgi:transcriptional regulator with XRE-family HTH domain
VSIDRRAFDRQLGVRLREARLTLGVTQAELAQALGTSDVSVARYELGERSLPVALLPRIARLLRIPIAHLLPSEGEPTPLVEPSAVAIPPPVATLVRLLVEHPELLPPLLHTLEQLLEQQRER